ncbi:unnamed protein product [Fraxinus pennsylvanica]|uniref:2-C-methyl-D-erythritol 2,4-cyclodiphosphate synthase domain-containing protein n=1 Tax=Fraxinus pennsylvanica TaxID=56036 RepID=A0AAD1ZT43_9LAMI|nr:unnamed protein product [Fraxinus pennsylvanica]
MTAFVMKRRWLGEADLLAPLQILRRAVISATARSRFRLMNEAGYELGNLDTSLILQRPKVSPHKEAILANLWELLGADPSVVNLKAKTHEKVDSLGENWSIAAHTVVLLTRKY